MIEYCLDTNVCIAIINGSSVPVRARLKAVLAEGSIVCVSAVVLHELWYGVAKSTQQESNTERVRAFLSGPFEVLPWDDEDARAAGEVRALLEKEGQAIGAYDALIAAQAVRRGVTLVTANTRVFKRVDGLMWEDWALSKGSKGSKGSKSSRGSAAGKRVSVPPSRVVTPWSRS